MRTKTMQVIKKYADYFEERTRKGGASHYVLCGGRRSGKTFAICQRLMMLCVNHRRIVNVATMTAEQGRLGAYADCKTIVELCPWLQPYVTMLESPREIRFRNGSRIFFNSYPNSETAKGVACDYVFLNEANNFTQQQYVDLTANARMGIFIDYNPNVHFWVDDFFCEEDILHTTWKDNAMLTRMQLDYFAKLKELGTMPNASPVNVRNYRVYYLGEYSELQGTIFTSDCLSFADEMPSGLRNFCIFCDPSALRGADWFACVLSAIGQDGKIYIVDTYSVNTGSREQMARHLRDWMSQYDVARCFIETNGIIGIDFYEFCINSELPVEGWDSKGNKFERIVGNFQAICDEVVFVRNERLDDFMTQVYSFDHKCDHDDNIDAIVSSYRAQKYSL